MMCQCWITEPKRRPYFSGLKRRLEAIWGRLSVLSGSRDPLYVNLGETCGASAADSILHSAFDNDDQCCVDIPETCGATAVNSDYRYIVNPGCLRQTEEWPPNVQTAEARGLLHADEDDEEEEIQEARVVINL